MTRLQSLHVFISVFSKNLVCHDSLRPHPFLLTKPIVMLLRHTWLGHVIFYSKNRCCLDDLSHFHAATYDVASGRFMMLWFFVEATTKLTETYNLRNTVGSKVLFASGCLNILRKGCKCYDIVKAAEGQKCQVSSSVRSCSFFCTSWW